jgi:hypothetical protein
MKNRTINLGVVAEVAQALGDLNDFVVFVGGAVVSIYADDKAADEVRPTQDIDLTLTLIDINQQDLDKQLAERGFHLDIHGHANCSYKYKDIAVDIMASTDTMLGPTNRWYAIGFDSLQQITIEATAIQILSAPCYLATKFEAFSHRGQNDYRTSHDFEDIIYVIDNRTTIVSEIEQSKDKVKEFLREQLSRVANSPYSEEILSAHLHPLILNARYPMLLEKIRSVIS